MEQHKSRLPLITVLFVILILMSAHPAAAAGTWKSLWTIGKFDGSSAEFLDAAVPDSMPIYVVGKSNAKQAWYAFQPGSGNGPAGDKPHPAEIQFDLAAPPAGVYRLRIAILVEHPRVSALQVAINGHAGRFYARPKLDFRQGDLIGAFFPEYSSATITALFPARYLQPGENKMILGAIDEPEPGDQVVIGGSPAGDSGLVYDALGLENDSARSSLEPSRAWAAPTTYYRTVNGGLVNLVDVFASFSQRPAQGSVALEVNGRSFKNNLPSDREFGEFRAEAPVPEFTSGTSANLTLSIDGKAQRFSSTLSPGKKWKFFVVPNEHLDVGFTDYQAKVAAVHERVIDEAMEFIRQHPDFRFSLDSDWEAEQFLHNRTQAERDAFLQMVQERKLFVPPQYANLLTGVPTAETLIRSLYNGTFFNSANHLASDYANITDVPSYSWSYASVLAAAGIKYYVAASNNDRAPVLLFGRLNEQSPFWWEGPDGSKVLMWYSRHYHQVLTLFGMPPQIAAGHDSLPVFLQMYQRPSYRSDAVILYGTQPENTDLFPQQAALAEHWDKIYAYPRMTFTGFSQAMDYITKQFGGDIKTVRGDGGPYWEDGIASDARTVALQRRNEVRALSAEKFSTISALVDSRLSPDRSILRRMWNDLVLMDEHTWDADVSITEPGSFEAVKQLQVKDALAEDGGRLVDQVTEESLGAIANSIQDPHETLLVFNSLSWGRNGFVEADLPEGTEVTERATGQSVPYEVLFKGEDYRRVRFDAGQVAALGYKAFLVKPGPKAPPPAATTLNAVLESPYYKVELDPTSGAVRSLFDKQLGRELVNQSSPYRLDQYVYVTGSDKLPNRLVDYSAVYPTPEVTTHLAGQGRLEWVKHTPFGTEARLVSSCMNTPVIETTILLSGSEKKIEFVNTIVKKQIYEREGVYFAFPFAMESPDFHYEIQNGVVDPARDMIPGAGLDWFTVQHWVSAGENGATVAVFPLDAPLVTLGDIVRGHWPKQFGKRNGDVFSYVMNNYWHTNYRAAQGGCFTFRYVMTSSAKLDSEALSHIGWNEITPLEVDRIMPQDQAVPLNCPLDPAQGSFLQVSNPDVLLTAWKRAENGHGTILRFLELGGRSESVSIKTPLLDIRSAWLCNAVESDESQLSVADGQVTFQAKPHQIVTLRLEGAPKMRSDAMQTQE